MTVTRLMVVDDHALFRRGLIGLISEYEGFEVVGEAGNGEEALRLLPSLDVDLVLLDINMPVLGGIATLREMRRTDPGLPVLMLTVSQNDNDLLDAIAAGASGYILKNTEPEALRQILSEVAAGRSVLSPELTEKLFSVLRRTVSVTGEGALSEREVQVLRCLARGLTTPQAARELFVTENTIKTHTRHILEKLGVSNRVEAVAKATSAGLI
jgi:DNA-binding NarL/FixJ family response regulator